MKSNLKEAQQVTGREVQRRKSVQSIREQAGLPGEVVGAAPRQAEGFHCILKEEAARPIDAQESMHKGREGCC